MDFHAEELRVPGGDASENPRGQGRTVEDHVASHGLSSARTLRRTGDRAGSGRHLDKPGDLALPGSMPQDLAMHNIVLFTPDGIEQHLGALAGSATLVSASSPG